MVRIAIAIAAVLAALSLIFGYLLLRPDDMAPAPVTLSNAAATTLAGIDPKTALVTDNARHWLDKAVAENGFYAPALNRDWSPSDEKYASLVTQGRLLYVFASAYDQSQDQRYLTALKSGADFLVKDFRDPNGGWVDGVTIDGQKTETKANDYDIAAAIFGLAHAYGANRDKRYLKAAMDMVANDASGMLMLPRLAAQGDMEGVMAMSTGVNTNALMHLLEALLALHDKSGDEQIWQDAEAVAKFATKVLMPATGGFIAENYDLSLKPGTVIDLGHQLEWAFFLSRAVEAGLAPVFLENANRLVDKTLALGIDPDQGGLWGEINGSTEAVTDKSKIWWRQTEMLRTLLHFQALRGRDDLAPVVKTQWAAVMAAFLDTEYGGWLSHDKASLTLTTTAPIKRPPYHEAGLYAEIARLKMLHD